MMPSNRFIAREDDVLDLETGIRYSTADDAEAVADLLNSTPPQPVSGDVVAAAKEIADDIAALAPIVPFDAYDALASAANRVRGLAATLASPEPESVVLEARAVKNPGCWIKGEWVNGFVCVDADLIPLELPDGFPIGPVRLTIQSTQGEAKA